MENNSNTYSNVSCHCYYCDNPIAFDNDHLSKNGKKIPLNLDLSIHDCVEKYTEKNKDFKPIRCNVCELEIIFLPDRINQITGHKIPIDPDTLKYHKHFRNSLKHEELKKQVLKK
jgi:hypothetical protein